MLGSGKWVRLSEDQHTHITTNRVVHLIVRVGFQSTPEIIVSSTVQNELDFSRGVVCGHHIPTAGPSHFSSSLEVTVAERETIIGNVSAEDSKEISNSHIMPGREGANPTSKRSIGQFATPSVTTKGSPDG